MQHPKLDVNFSKSGNFDGFFLNVFKIFRMCLFFLMFIFEREREHKQGRGRERERETQNPKQAPGSEPDAGL